MRTLFVIAAFLLASTAAQAQYTFDYGGRTITIDPDRGTVSIPGVYDNTGKKAKRSRNRAFAGSCGCARNCGSGPRRDRDPASGRRARAAGPAGSAARSCCPAGTRTCRCDGTSTSTSSEAAGSRPRRRGKLAARRMADRRERGQGSDRAMRLQPLRIFRGRQVEPERRTGSDQHEAWHRRQVERADSRSEQRQHL